MVSPLTLFTYTNLLLQKANYYIYSTSAGRNHAIQYSVDSPQTFTVNDDELALGGTVREACADSRTMSDVHSVLDAGFRLGHVAMLVITCHSSAGHE